MTIQSQNLYLIGQAVADNLRYWTSGCRQRCRSAPESQCSVPPDFFGICVASAPDPACDSYVIARLKELGVSCVRLDFSYDSFDSYGERFLKHLLAASLRVCLHLVQPLADVKAMVNPETQERWRTFVAKTLATYGSRLDMLEIGATCNRRRWSGYTPVTFLLCWQIAWEETQHHGLTLAGPNVTDFEPFYNVAILSELKRSGMLPAIHTDNLFVERATEPEALDHKILGRRLAGVLRFNLIRKAQILHDIGRWAGVPEFICSHVAWSLRRIARRQDHIEEKQADYVTRYACLAAASGALRRMYWGPMIGQREGLIDDGTSAYPDIPHVTFYGHIHGRPDDYRLRPAFAAFKTVNRFLSGAAFRRKITTGPGLEILEFVQTRQVEERSQGSEIIRHPSPITHQPSTILHVVWTTNGNCAEASDCYPPEILTTAEAYARDGGRLAQLPALFSESPVYLFFTSEQSAVSSKQSEKIKYVLRSNVAKDGERHENVGALLAPSATKGPLAPPRGDVAAPALIPKVRFASIPGMHYAPIRHEPWTGFYLAEDSGLVFNIHQLLALLLDPHASESKNDRPLSPSATILRDSRNCVWTIPAPGERSRRLVIKRFNPPGFWRKLTQRHQPDRAQRSWNGAQELLRRGIPTPQPLAFIHNTQFPATRSSFYICRSFENGWSAREAFTAFSQGATQFQGKSATDLFEAMARFLRTLHDRGVFFRDLSAGNLLFRCEAEGDIECTLIDTTRARFYPAAVGLRQRLCDLIRLCHPLNWKGREDLVATYMRFSGRRFRLWMKIPFAYYDAKHRVKNALKRRRSAS